ncbi:hypothetical protein BJ138DRAFT_1157356 [Hygrophoropsis aurantiaca]|uniref:Uncharacterized protein n=1 Tax=Hygrophoropsis aurantiaca TaxID=72124 RepID=A0ACB8A5G6_9AGAM|nr:hypothetical protein BJ138DRAFT_1157356 [Hygrophoropsis aurantiaca]
MYSNYSNTHQNVTRVVDPAQLRLPNGTMQMSVPQASSFMHATSSTSQVDVSQYLSDLHAQKKKEDERRRKAESQALLNSRRGGVDLTHSTAVLHHSHHLWPLAPIAPGRTSNAWHSAPGARHVVVPQRVRDTWKRGNDLLVVFNPVHAVEPRMHVIPDPNGTNINTNTHGRSNINAAGYWGGADATPAKSVNTNWSDANHGRGMAVTELFHYGARGLDRPNDAVIDGFGLEYIDFRILWPGYNDYCKRISASEGGKPITRRGLAYDVCMMFAEWIHHITTNQIRPHPAFAEWSLDDPVDGAGLIRMENLRLVNVRNTCGNDWQAEVVVVRMEGQDRRR